METRLLEDLLLRGAERHPERELLWIKNEWHTWGAVAELTARVAAYLASQGVRPGDRVVFILENGVEYVAAVYGALRVGAVTVAINHSTVADEILGVLQDCEPVAVVAQRSVLKHLAAALAHPGAPGALRLLLTVGGVMPRESAAGRTTVKLSDALERPAVDVPADPRGPHDLCSIVYTSGTTGKPKGVMLSHANLVSNAESIVEYLGLTERDRVMCVLPFFFSYGNSLLTTHLAAGGSLVLHNGFVFPNVILDEMIQTRCTGLSGVPSTYALLLHRSKFKQTELPHLRYATIAGGGLPGPAQAELAKVIPRAAVFNMYGQTEAAARLSYLDPGRLGDKLGSIGKGIPGVELRVVTPDGVPVEPGVTGEIIARGPNVMLGYWNSPDETRSVLRDGWLWTGDLATVDDEGFVFIVSRKKDIIKSGAYRIGPIGIESVLAEHPAVAEAAVVGAPDKLLGEAIVAYVIVRPEADLTERDLMAHCHERLPSYKIPKTFKFAQDLPRTTSGKVQKHLLKEQEERLARERGELE
jgi:acyl-CoA synthetase (AMP-forming)/AMP-acid ligase II